MPVSLSRFLPGSNPARAWHRFALGLAVVALWLASVNLPGPPVLTLDSWHAILVDAQLNGRQFGHDIVFTYGPLGHLSLSGHFPEALPRKFAWEIFGKLALALTVVLATGAVAGVRRWLLLAAFAWGIAFFDNTAGVVIALLTLVWLLPPGAANWQRALAIGWLALFAHFKFTFCLQAVAGLVLAVATCTAERRFRDAVALLTSFAVAYVAVWLAAGQHLAHLPAYWRLSWEIGSGYSWAMGATPTPATLLAGLLTASFCGAFLHLIWRADLSATQRAGAALVMLLNWFMAWKHGFTRADQHVFAFFFFCLILGVALPGLFAPRRTIFGWRDLNLPVCLAGIALTGGGLLTFGPRVALDHWRRFPYELTHLDAWTQRFVTAFENTRAAAHDPTLTAAIGHASVDLLNFDQWALLLNDLNYRPRPVPQSYAVYTDTLAATNAAFFLSDRAPEFVVLRLGAIDGRYPGQEDGLALAALAQRYTVDRIESAYTLLRRKPADATPPPPRPLLAEATPSYGTDVAVPNAGRRAVWLEIDLRPTLLGRVLTLLYHASAPQLVATTASGEQKCFRLVPTTSGSGFIVSPLIETHADFAALLHGRTGTTPRAVRIELEKPSHRWLWHAPRVRFFSMPEPPPRLDSPLHALAATESPRSDSRD